MAMATHIDCENRLDVINDRSNGSSEFQSIPTSVPSPEQPSASTGLTGGDNFVVLEKALTPSEAAAPARPLPATPVDSSDVSSQSSPTLAHKGKAESETGNILPQDEVQRFKDLEAMGTKLTREQRIKLKEAEAKLAAEEKRKKHQSEIQRLKELESQVDMQMVVFWTTGRALLEIKERQLYREEVSGKSYLSFGDYLHERFGYISRGYQLMTATRARQLLENCGVANPDSICKNEQQYRDLSMIVKAEKGSKLEVFKEFVANQQREGTPLTKDILEDKLAEICGDKLSKSKELSDDRKAEKRNKIIGSIKDSLGKSLKKYNEIFDSKISLQEFVELVMK